MADPQCTERGIAPRLHSDGKPLVEHFEQDEKLFRRFKLEPKEDTMWTCITFSIDKEHPERSHEMSVNRGAPFSEEAEPADALINEKTGERFAHCGVLEMRAVDFEGPAGNGEWAFETRRFVLRLIHAPCQCNYPHANVVVTEVTGGVEARRKLPDTLKQALREHLTKRVIIALPVERSGHKLPLR